MSVTQASTIDTTPIAPGQAAAIEAAEAHAWSDMYSAAPTHWAAAAGLGLRWIDGSLALCWAASGRRYFSRAIGLGVTKPASETQLDRILALWRGLGIDMFLVQSLPHGRPNTYERWLHERGLEAFDAQDRVIRGGQPLSSEIERAALRQFEVEPVTADSAGEWSRFVQDVYRLDTGPWLPRLIGRRGWHQYVTREAGEIVAARGMYIGQDRIAWLGIDAPVPGITSGDYEPDAALCARIVSDGLARGANAFIADIEAPTPLMDTPAYRHFSALGFRRPYVRTHYTRIT
jgi:hypothetical protein